VIGIRRGSVSSRPRCLYRQAADCHINPESGRQDIIIVVVSRPEPRRSCSFPGGDHVDVGRPSSVRRTTSSKATAPELVAFPLAPQPKHSESVQDRPCRIRWSPACGTPQNMAGLRIQTPRSTATHEVDALAACQKENVFRISAV